MNTDFTDVYELHSSRTADYRLLADMPTLDNVDITLEGSPLATSLLSLPDAFNESTATLILDTVSLVPCEQTENLAEHFAELADKDTAEQKLEELDVDNLELVLDLWTDDQEAAAMVFQDFTGYLAEQRSFGQLEALRLLRTELEAEQGDVTIGQLLLLMNESTQQTASYAFPNARDMFNDLATYEPELTAAEARRKDRKDRAERNRITGAGNRRTYSITDLETMILLDEDPVALAAMAVNTKDVKSDQLLDILEHAEASQLRDWMFAREVVQPKTGQIADLMKRLPADRVDELIKLSHEMLTSEAATDGLMTCDLPYVFEIIENVFVPRVILSPETAMVVYHQLSKRIGDDPSTWAAVLMADTGTDPVRFQDMLL